MTPPRSEWLPRSTIEDERALAYTDSDGVEFWWCNEVCREPHRSGRSGAWFVYNWDWNAYPIGLFGSELEARRFAAEGYEKRVVFWPFGTEWDAVKS